MSPAKNAAATAFMVVLLAGAACGSVGADRTVNLYFFYGRDCHVCKDLKPVVEDAGRRHPELNVVMLEVQYNSTNNLLLNKTAEAYGKKMDFVPAIFIGAEVVEGYVAGHTEERLEEIVSDCIANGCVDPMEVVEGAATTLGPEPAATTATAAAAAATATLQQPAEKNSSRPVICPISKPCGVNETTTTTTVNSGAAAGDDTTTAILAGALAAVILSVVFIAYNKKRKPL